MTPKELGIKLNQAKLYLQYNNREDQAYRATITCVDEKGKRILIKDIGNCFEFVYNGCLVVMASDEPVRALAMLMNRWNFKVMNTYGEIENPFLDVKKVERLMKNEGLRVVTDETGKVYRKTPDIQGLVVEPDGTVIDRLPGDGRFLPESILLRFHPVSSGTESCKSVD